MDKSLHTAEPQKLATKYTQIRDHCKETLQTQYENTARESRTIVSDKHFTQALSL